MELTFPPAYRIAYDLDDTSVRIIGLDDQSTLKVPSQYLKKMNDESYSTQDSIKITCSKAGWQSLVFIFKEPIDFHSYCMFGNFEGISGASIDFNSELHPTSNGFNGIWDGAISIINNDIENIGDEYRTKIVLAPYNNIRAIRFNLNFSSSSSYLEIGALHLYGLPNENTGRKLILCDDEGNELSPDYFYFENTSTTTREFYIKNVSNKKITEIKIFLDVLTETIPSILSQYSLSLNNSIWTNSVTLLSGNNIYQKLDPGQIFGPIYFKQNILPNAQSGSFAGKIFVDGKTIS